MTLVVTHDTYLLGCVWFRNGYDMGRIRVGGKKVFGCLLPSLLEYLHIWVSFFLEGCPFFAHHLSFLLRAWRLMGWEYRWGLSNDFPWSCRFANTLSIDDFLSLF